MSNSIYIYIYIYTFPLLSSCFLWHELFQQFDLLITFKGSFIQQLFRAQLVGVMQLQLMYFTELQLQLGGFGGINYTFHTGNPATRPMEPGIAKAGLISPKLPQPHAPAFAKVSS